MCAVLSAIDLAKMDAIVLASLDTTCTIARPTNSTQTFSDNSESYMTKSTGTRCMAMEPTVQGMNAVGGSNIIGTQQTFEIRLPLGTDVLPNDRLTLADGTVFRVQDILLPMTPYRRLLFISASLVR